MCERELETEQNCNILTPTLMAIRVSFLFWCCSTGGRGPTPLGAGFFYRILSPTGLVSKLTDFLSSPSYIIVQLSIQYLPITGHWNVSLLPSLEWHVWSPSCGNNCHAVHRSLSSGASVCTIGFEPCKLHIDKWICIQILLNGLTGKVKSQRGSSCGVYIGNKRQNSC